ncbi:MAG: DUF6580 family putative transport protein [Patescibacteria group bacterium]
MNTRFLFMFLFLGMGLSIATRFLPHPPNFVSIGALSFFVGVYAVKVSRWYLLIPLVVMVVSDMFLGLYDWKIMAVVYMSFLATGLIGFLVARKRNLCTVILGSLGGALLFYLTTNFAVWAFSGMYPLTPAGLLTSYAMALPFFRNTILGDLFYTGLFFGLYESILVFPNLLLPFRRGRGFGGNIV